MSHVFLARSFRLAAIALLVAALWLNPGLPTQAKPKVAYVPEVSLVPDVLQPDGQMPRAYTTLKGSTLWTAGLPILQGDKIKLNIFVATGGADVQRVIVRLDNAKIADLKAAPWNTLLDTTPLPVGYHMVEVWAQASGDRPQTNTKTLSFYVTKEMPVQYAVKGSQQVLQNGTISNVPLDTATPSAVLETAPDVPSFLKGQPADAQAQIALSVRSAQGQMTEQTDASVVMITEPTVLAVTAPPGSVATRYAYALTRNGKVVSTSTQPLSITYERIRIQKRTETMPGLRSGTITLWAWGIDKDGHPGTPAKVQLMIP